MMERHRRAASALGPCLVLAALAGLALAAFLAAGGLAGQGTRQALAVAIGAAAGVALYHAAFGFAGAWRRLLHERRGRGLRAQVLLIALACLVGYPLIGHGDAVGLEVRPAILPMGLSSALGALMFGIGMHLGGGCASGTLFTAGGGSVRMAVTLAAFVAGSVWATAHLHEVWFRLDDWTGIPDIPGTSLIVLFGPFGGLGVLLAVLGVLWAVTVALERRAHGRLEAPRPTGTWLRGPWSPWTGAVALALVSIACLVALGRPWGVTAAFALWGAGIARGIGLPVETWGYWSGWRAGQLEAGALADATSVMNAGLFLGAMAAAMLAGRFAPRARLTRREVASALIGGLLMGYGARLAYGCNIGAYLGGLVSGSLHGLWWLVFGFAGFAIAGALAARHRSGRGRAPRAD